MNKINTDDKIIYDVYGSTSLVEIINSLTTKEQQSRFGYVDFYEKEILKRKDWRSKMTVGEFKKLIALRVLAN